MAFVIKGFLLCIAIGSILACPLFAQTATADVWAKLESPNFELIGNGPLAKLTTTANRLERFRAAVHKLFLIETLPRRPKIRVVVFKDSASFRPFKPKLANGAPDDAANGYFLSGTDIDYIAIAADGSFSDIFHEYSHALLAQRSASSDIPPWLNEGLAEYLRSFQELDDRAVEFGSTLPQHLITLRTHHLMAWDKLFRIDNFTLQQSGAEERKRFYAQSWALVQFVVGRRSETSISDIVESLSKVQDSSPNRIDRFDIADLDNGVKDLIAQRSAVSARRRLESESQPLALTYSSLSEARSAAYLGDLLYRLYDDSAENYVRKALAAEPDLAMANATLGLIRLRERRFDEARSLFEKALAAEKNNFLINYYCAFLITREFMDEFGSIKQLPADALARVRSYLDASIRANPHFAESYALLANVGLIAGDLDAALVAAAEAVRLQPADDESAVLLARAYARLNRFNEARLVAEKIVRRSANTYLRNEATAIISAVAQMSETATGVKRAGLNLIMSGQTAPVILKWRDLTAEQLAKIDEDRENNNINILLDRPANGESLALGRIEQISCRNQAIYYKLRTADGVLNLATREFNDLKLKVLTAGTRSFMFKCGADLSSELIVARYRVADRRVDTDGFLVSITFVPKNFRLKSPEQIASEPLIVIEGMPASNISGNLATSQAERIEMERVMREAQMTEIYNRLRQPEPSEMRLVAVPESLECKDETMIITARSQNSIHTFHTPIAKKIYLQSLNPDAGFVEFGCRAKLPSVPAVFTYTQPKTPAAKPSLIALEFVPEPFKLN